MPEAVTIEFECKGVQTVSRAFDTIEQRMIRAETAGTKSAERGSRARVLATQSEAKERDAAYARLVRETEKWTAQDLRTAEKAAREKVRGEQQMAREIERIRERSALMAGRWAEESASKEIAARKKIANSLGNHVVSGAGRVLSGLGSLAMGAATIGGGFALADAARDSLSSGKAATALKNALIVAGVSSDKGELLSRSKAAQAATNISKMDLLRGQTQYSKLASADMGPENLMAMAKLAKATGTDFGEMATLAGNIRVQNRGLTDKGMMDMLRNTVGQGGKGAMLMDDLAAHGATITSTAGMYGGDVSENQGKLLGLSQIARRTSADPAEAAKSVERFSQDLATKGSKLGKYGISVNDKNGALKDPAEILGNIFEKMGGKGRAGMLGALGGRGGALGKESIRVVEALQDTYERGGKGKAGADAVRKDVSAMEKADLTQDAVDKMLTDVLSDPAEKLASSFDDIRETIEIHLVKVLEKFADLLRDNQKPIEDFIEALGKVAEFLVNNPFVGVGTAVALSIGKSCADAAIGEAVKAAILKAWPSGVTPPGGAPQGGPGSAPPGSSAFLDTFGKIIPAAGAVYSMILEGKAGMATMAAGASKQASDEIATESPAQRIAKMIKFKQNLGMTDGGVGRADRSREDVYEHNYIRLVEQSQKGGGGPADTKAIEANTRALEANTAATKGNTGGTSAPINPNDPKYHASHGDRPPGPT